MPGARLPITTMAGASAALPKVPVVTIRAGAIRLQLIMAEVMATDGPTMLVTLRRVGATMTVTKAGLPTQAQAMGTAAILAGAAAAPVKRPTAAGTATTGTATPVGTDPRTRATTAAGATEATTPITASLAVAMGGDFVLLLLHGSGVVHSTKLVTGGDNVITFAMLGLQTITETAGAIKAAAAAVTAIIGALEAAAAAGTAATAIGTDMGPGLVLATGTVDRHLGRTVE